MAETITVTLRMAADGNVECNLQTNGLPFPVVEAQLRKFIASLQWQLDERARCQFHTQGETPAGDAYAQPT